MQLLTISIISLGFPQGNEPWDRSSLSPELGSEFISRADFG